MDLVSITPNILDFGLTSENYRPVSVNFTIRNETNDDLQINFGDISSSSMWFTLFDQVIEQQRNLGFDIFYHYEKIDNLKLFAQEEQMLSLVMIPVCCAISFNPSLSIPIMKFKDDELQTDEKFYYPIKVQSTISDVSFKISPQYLFLNECCNFQPQTKSFQIKNTSDRELPIVIYPDESITVDTPEYPNYILLKPKSISTLTLHHIPTEIGQFDHKIIFECLLDQLSDPKVMHVNSSVSPAEVPDDFPTITPQNAEIDFGEVNAGIPVESSFTLTNHSEVTYSVSVNGVLDTFTGSLPSSESLSSAIFIPHASSSQLLFKGTASSKSESKLDITLRSHSALTIYATYVPSFHLSADSTSFEHRTFMITLTFADKSTSNVFYRRIKCKSAVCHPTISISPSLIEFGDTIVGQTDKSAEIIIRNHSPLPTTVSISTSSRSLTVPSIPVEIDGHSTYKYKFKFYPRRVSPDYTASIKFTNNNNISNEVQLSISAIIVANSSESIHSMSYNILSDGQHVSSFDFQNCSINYPSLKSFVIKNRLNTPLKLRFSASTDEIKFYQEDSVYLLNSSSFGNYSNSSIVSVTNQPNEPTSTTLLTPTQTYSLKQLEQSMQINSEFFMNQFILSQKYSDQQIIEHFDTAYQQINKLIENGSLINLENLTIEIPPQFKFEITILLKPRSINGEEPMFWKHREEKIFVHLIDQNQNIEARTIPLKFNVVQSKSFLSTRHLNFGNILCNTRYQNKLYISNESALPFLFELESKNINFDNQSYCIAFPISTYSIPCHFIRNIDGKFTEEVIIKNVLNPEEKHTIIFKGKASRRTNSFIDPLLLDFGDIVACSSSKRLRLFITNTSNEEIEFTLSHVQKETLMCKPLITYQFKYLNSRRLTENVQLQIEKLGCKLRCLQRKNKIEYAQKIQRLIDNLSNTTIDNTSTQLKQMDAKYMDCFTFRCAPLQMVCIELQLIPSILSGKRISISIPLEGAILIYENKRIETQKIVHYKAHLIPNTQRLLDSVVQKSLIVEPTFIEINDIFVHESVRTHIKLKNISNTLQNYWISSDGNNNNCIISSPKSEGSIKTQESLELAIDIFPLNPGKITKIINITTQTSVINITLQIHSEFKPVLSFPSLPENSTIDFGYIPLTSLQVIEERSAFNIFNISNNILYLSILNDHQKEIIVYEKDSRQPQTKEFMLNPHQLIRMNVLLQPEIDLIHYQKYLTTLINGKLLIKAYETLEEAQHSTIQPAIFEKEITVNAAFGRIGISCSEQNIDLGTVSKKLMNAKCLIPEVTGVEIFMRKTEIKIDSLDLQPNETVEVRIKVMAEKSDGWSSSVLARIHFVSDGEEVAKLDVTV
ncbi:hypothetical protein GPJ56_007715 [Histomonas meleagridis]|uniref:uncharacterized protein n=1 Tax=Histomonas meleagridis TaxID=135588 RepID=UPI003559D432|nr:hypothetical protein GPJ56_007715 [Histomonas meleagridis]KAH0801541.1 hypothetical protein GO595_005677 [Histomonas meleagridis]